MHMHYDTGWLWVTKVAPITERWVPQLIPVLGSQPADDVSHKPGGRLPLLSARPAVTPATLKRAATSFAARWTEARWVWTVCLRLLPDISIENDRLREQALCQLYRHKHCVNCIGTLSFLIWTICWKVVFHRWLAAPLKLRPYGTI